MFLDEARVAANLHHQHIVQVHDIGESDGEYFIAMEYIHGEDVRMLLSTASKTRAHVPLVHAVAVVSAAAAGLHYAHERRGGDMRPLGIVHRDISPSNILVGYDGSIKILDFGLATATMRQETSSGSLKGKISYMSPEQCKGAPIDRRSDVYSLGVVLYELATTTRLFKGESDYVVMDQIVKGKVSLPQVRRPDLPNELSAIIMRAIAPDPERRYFTADELRVALDQFATKAGLTVSTSGIASYMHKQFGERPEPWLELEAQGIYSFDDLEIPIDESLVRNSWAEIPQSGETFRRSSSSIPRQTGPIGLAGGNVAFEGGSLNSARPHQAAARLPTTTPPTSSSMGWESQRPARMLRGLTPARLAMIGAPLLLILGVAIGRLVWTDSGAPTSEPAPAPALQPVAVVVPPPPPPVVQNLEPPPVAAAAVQVDNTDAKTTARNADPSSKNHALAATTKRTSTTKVETSAARTPSPSPKIDRPTTPPPAAASPASALSTSPGGSPSLQASAPLPAAIPAVATPVAPVSLPPPPPLPAPPQTVAPTALDANRIAGDKEIIPDENTQSEIGRAGVDKLVASYKVCITADGSISAVTQLKSSGFTAYDAKILNTIRDKWRYRPFMVNGKAAAVCTAVRFIYSQK